MLCAKPTTHSLYDRALVILCLPPLGGQLCSAAALVWLSSTHVVPFNETVLLQASNGHLSRRGHDCENGVDLLCR